MSKSIGAITLPNLRLLPFERGCSTLLWLTSIIIYCGIVGNIYSQTNAKSYPKTSIQQYSVEPNKIVHLHLNKTIFLPGESIWFKCYIYDTKLHKLSKMENNMILELFNSNGKEITRKLIYLQGGVGSGYIKLDSTFQDAIYYVKASIPYLIGNEHPGTFYEQIQILGNKLKDTNRGLDSLTVPSITIFPEGGKLVQGVENTLVVKVTGISRTDANSVVGSLVSIKGNEILSNIRINQFGLAKFNYPPNADSPVILVLNFPNGIKFSKELPIASPKGIAWSVNIFDPNNIKIAIKSNDIRINDDNGPLIINFRQNQFSKAYAFEATENIQFFQIPKATLPPGINYLSLIDQDDKVLLRRIIYNDYNALSPPTTLVWKSNAQSDSLYIKIDSQWFEDENFSMSISALPASTKAYQVRSNIQSSFQLLPYLDDKVTMPSYFFKEDDRHALYDLDLFLLTIDDEDFNWNTGKNLIDTSTASLEPGIELRGKVLNNGLRPGDKLWMYVDNSSNAFFSDIGKNGEFDTRAVLFEGDSLNITLINSNGTLVFPKLKLNYLPELENSALDLQSSKITFEPVHAKYYQENLNSLYETDEDLIELEEVELVERRFPLPTLLSPNVINDIIDEQDINNRVIVANYLRRLGYKLNYNSGQLTVLAAIPGPLGRYPKVPVFVDGLVSDGYDIFNLPMRRIKSISYDFNRSSFIAIELKNEIYKGISEPNKFITIPIKNAYSKSKPFTNLKFYNYSDPTFRQYGVVFWEPLLNAGPEQPLNFSIPRYEQDKILLYIEGIGDKGTLLSTCKIIDLNDP